MLEQAIRHQAAFIHALDYEHLRESTLSAAKRILLDSLGCMAAGNIRLLKETLPPGSTTLIGTGQKTDSYTAVFLNGTAMVQHELDEGNQFAFGHPACHILPALLAECETKPVSPQQFFAAFVAAYETACRWSGAVKLYPEAHIHGTVATMGSAVAVCKLDRSEEEALFHAIVLANSLPQATSWTAAFHGDSVRNAYIGLCNLVGGHAARMGTLGIQSSVATLQSIWNDILGTGINVSQLTDGLGQDWLVEKNYFKQYSACRYIHAIADMCLEFRAMGITADRIQSICIQTYQSAAKLGGQQARNGFAARFSIPVSVAILFAKGALTLDTVTDAMALDPEINALAQKITVEENPAYTALLPNIRTNQITLVTTDGTVYQREAAGAQGDYNTPFSDEALERKFKAITTSVWNHSQQQRIIHAILHLDKAADMGELLALLSCSERRVLSHANN